jgi:hypothetical protein
MAAIAVRRVGYEPDTLEGERDLADLHTLIGEASRRREHLTTAGAHSSERFAVQPGQKPAYLPGFATIEALKREIDKRVNLAGWG